MLTRVARQASWSLLIIGIFAMAPLSVKLFFTPIQTEVVLPVEPLIGVAALVMLVWAWRIARQAGWRALLPKDAISWCVCAHAAWMVACVPFSNMPWVSAKAVVVRICYLLVFYAGVRRLLREDQVAWWWAMRWYALAFVVVIAYVLYNMRDGFTRNIAGFAPFPFYNDHTIYAAAAVFVLLFLAVDGWQAVRQRWRPWAIASAVPVFMALLFSYSRAGWLSLAIALGVGFALAYGRKVVLVGGMLLLIPLTAFPWDDDRWHSVIHGSVDSYTPNAGFYESITSMADISKDASNRERLNRWNADVGMFKERPVLGFGPGTFQFVYHGYQQPEDRTYLTVDSLIPQQLVTRAWSATPEVFVRANPQIHFSSGGTAHSEYLLVLAECGAMALVLQVATLLVALYIGFRSPRAPCTTYALLALTAYAVHGIVNNFLDDPKIAALYFSALAILSMGAQTGGADHQERGRSSFKAVVSSGP